jgi:serine/threonine protein kinase
MRMKKMASAFDIGPLLGIGAYGCVYSAVNRKTKEKVAIKRNMCDAEIRGIGSLSEADFLTRLSGHPHIVEFLGVIFGTGYFKNDVSKHFPNDEKEDSLHFILGLESGNLDKNLRKREIPMKNVKHVCAQLLLGIEWIHSRGIVHRDVKPANILYSVTDTGAAQIRICDFGLGGSMCGGELKTPGLVTSWYRAPEICFKADYSEKVDIWSAGCCLFEFASRHPFLNSTRDENTALLTAMFKKIPHLASIKTIKEVAGDSFTKCATAVFPRLSTAAKAIIMDDEIDDDERAANRVASIRELLGLSAARVQEFNEADGGSLDEFCDLISRLIAFDPNKRLSASEALNHEFFSGGLRAYIEETRADYPPTGLELPVVVIYDCPERTNAYELAIRLYNHRTSIPWYTHRIIFHALDLFDRYLEHMFTRVADGNVCALHTTSREVFLRMYVCMYMFHKLFTTLDSYEKWEAFVPSGYSDPATIEEACEFELFLFRDVCKYELYRDTLLEVMAFEDGRVRESRVRECLVKLGRISGGWADGSVRALGRFFNTFSE